MLCGIVCATRPELVVTKTHQKGKYVRAWGEMREKRENRETWTGAISHMATVLQ